MNRFGHERLDVYQVALNYCRSVYEIVPRLKGNSRHARDQWLRASQSIPLNIAEGNGKSSAADRRRYFEIARGSTLECAAIMDVLRIANKISIEELQVGKTQLLRIASMLTKLAAVKKNF